MKKTLMIMVGILIVLTTNVKAQEDIFFTNKYEVNFTEKEYNFISDLYYLGFQNIMQPNDYENIFNIENIANTEITKKTYESKDLIVPFGTNLETAGKIFEISKTCPTTCIIVLKAKWKSMPKIRSYDVIGARLVNTSLNGIPTTVIDKDGSKSTLNNDFKSLYNGFGVSLKLPTGGNSLIISQTFKVSKGGTVYGSYQHATKTISLANSKDYTISPNGLGRVFQFNNGYNSYYDSMAGVDIAV